VGRLGWGHDVHEASLERFNPNLIPATAHHHT